VTAQPEIAGGCLVDTSLVSAWMRAPSAGVVGEYGREELLDHAGAVTAEIEPHLSVSGEAVALQAPNDARFLIGLLALLACGARVIVIAESAPRAEVERYLRAAGGVLLMRFGQSGVVPERVVSARAVPGMRSQVLIPTSGSTGAPKLVERTEASLVAEGQRYRAALALHSGDRIVLPLPLHHAYGLGWLAAGLVSGAAVLPMEPHALGAVADALQRATVLGLVATTARLLSRRAAAGGRSHAAHLRVAMVGASPVDAALDEAFEAAFGVRLARNFGTTETGAVLAGLPPLPPGCVGIPLPGADCRILRDGGAPCRAGEAGRLFIRSIGDWVETGDLAARDVSGAVTIHGRASTRIRRGARWVSPREIETALLAIPGVADAHVCGVATDAPGEERILAQIVVDGATKLDDESLLERARAQLAPFKVPDRIVRRSRLPRQANGKIAAAPRYRAAPPQALLEVARAYKRSELLFALRDLGVLDALDGSRDTYRVAERCGLDLEAAEVLLEVAEAVGLVTRDDSSSGFDAAPYVELESSLSRTWTTREAIADAARRGPGGRRFEREGATADFSVRYCAAMHGPQTRFRRALARRRAGVRSHHRVLEVTVGPGAHLDDLLRANQETDGVLLQLSTLAGESTERVIEAAVRGRVRVGVPDESDLFDVCIVSNAVHGPEPGSCLSWLLDRLRPGGRLLIDDLFLPREGSGSEIVLDWLTHGGVAWRRLDELTTALDGLSNVSHVAAHQVELAGVHAIVVATKATLDMEDQGNG
jgi:long-chain acyl-CoA synthetase